MWKVVIFSIWCSVSVFSKTEIYFESVDSSLYEWLEEARFPSRYLRLDNENFFI